MSEQSEEKEKDLNNKNKIFLLLKLLKLNRRVIEKNIKVIKKIITKGGLKITFIISQFVILAILLKNRLSTESSRLPCRIVKFIRGAYTLLYIYSLLRGLHQGSTLKAILDGVTFDILEIVPLKVKRLTLPYAVTLTNNRKSIAAQ